jgi:hypothetical protein
MWSPTDWRHLFMIAGLIGVVVFCIPSALMFARLPVGGERFSELYVLGPTHMAYAYPSNVMAGEEYLVFLGVGNHMRSSSYYEVVVKLRNSSEVLPNATAGVPSPLPMLYKYETFLTDGQVWEEALRFTFSNVTLEGNMSSIGEIDINGASFEVNKTATWDNEKNGFFYQLFMELWIYDPQSSNFSFDSRYVALWLNVTGTV